MLLGFTTWFVVFVMQSKLGFSKGFRTFRIMNKGQQHAETLITGLIWMLLILYPIFGAGSGAQTDWDQVYREWIQLIPFFLIFIIHHFILFPQLVLNRRYGWYALLILAVIVGISLLSPMKRFIIEWLNLTQQPATLPPEGDFPWSQGPHLPPIKPLGLFYSIIISLMIVGFDAAILLSMNWYRSDREKQRAEKERLGAELAFLRNQVSPHFFMNTLNNIHALIDENQELAKESVIRLSKLMRYLLYEADAAQVPLKKEVEFLQSYIDLMRLRFSEKLRLHIHMPDEVPAVSVAPMLTIAFVENAFKHGVSYQHPSEINIALQYYPGRLVFDVRNTLHEAKEQDLGGVGLSNIRKRLELLYGKNYQLDIVTAEKLFSVHLIIPIDEDQSNRD